MKELFELNYSKINSYLFCPFLYRYVYLEGKYPPHNAYTSFGISIHRTLKRYALEGGDLESLFIFYEESWKNDGYKTPQEMMEFYGKGRKLLENFWFKEQEEERKIIRAEENFEFEHGEFVIRGTIDRADRRADGKIELIEYKTGGEERSEETLKKDKQLGIYACGLSKSMRLKPDFLSFYLLSAGKKITVPYDASSEKTILDFLSEMGEKLRSKTFDSKGNCGICLIRKLCPESEAKLS